MTRPFGLTLYTDTANLLSIVKAIELALARQFLPMALSAPYSKACAGYLDSSSLTFYACVDYYDDALDGSVYVLLLCAFWCKGRRTYRGKRKINRRVQDKGHVRAGVPSLGGWESLFVYF